MAKPRHKRGLTLDEIMDLGVDVAVAPSFVDLVNQRQLVSDRLRIGRSEHAALARYLADIQIAEKEFAAHMRRLVKRDTISSEGVVRDTWQHVCTVHEGLARHHEKIANQLQEFIEKINGWIQSTDRACQQMENAWRKADRNTLKPSRNTVRKKREHYNEVYKQCKEAKVSFEDLESRYGRDSPRVRSKELTLSKYKKSLSDAKRDYSGACKEHQHVHEDYEKKVEKIVEDLKKIETTRIIQAKNIFISVSNLLDATSTKHRELIKRPLSPAIDAMDAEKDIQAFVVKHANTTLEDQYCKPQWLPNLFPSGSSPSRRSKNVDDGERKSKPRHNRIKSTATMLKFSRNSGHIKRPNPRRARTEPSPSHHNELIKKLDDEFKWEKLLGEASKIEVGKSDSVVILKDSNIHEYTHGQWQKLEGMSQSLSVGADGTICTVSRSGLVFARETPGTEFKHIPGIDNVRDISVGSRLHIVAVTKSGDIYIYNHEWQKIEGSSAINCSIGHDGELWCIDKRKRLKRYREETGWIKEEHSQKNPLQVIVGDTNSIFVRYEDNSVSQRKSADRWESVHFGDTISMKHLSVAFDGTVAKITRDNSIFINRNGFGSARSSISSPSLNSACSDNSSDLSDFSVAAVSPPPAPSALNFKTPTPKRSLFFT